MSNKLEVSLNNNTYAEHILQKCNSKNARFIFALGLAPDNSVLTFTSNYIHPDQLKDILKQLLSDLDK